MSHPTSVSVVIPVGPGHQDVAREAAASVAGASIPGGFSVETLLVPDVHGALGRSAARNLGVEESSGDWILFMDADDLLQPNAFHLLARELALAPSIEGLWGGSRRIVTIWDPARMAVTGQRVVEFPDMQTRETDRARILGLSCWLNVGHFVRRDLHERVGGWCLAMDLAEDYEYLWACLSHARRFSKIPEVIVTVRANLRSAVGPRGYTLSFYEDATYATAKLRGEVIRAYWTNRGWVPWTPEERDNRPWIYSDEWVRFGNEPTR
jgi:glycosyltransferase involved in cell wall biosynthesis